MKKLKIFLLLSILLSFGFVLSSEVHAQSNGPKLFEVDDILPATTQFKISWDSGLNSFLNGGTYIIETLERPLITIGYHQEYEEIVFFIYSEDFGFVEIFREGWISPYTDYSGGHNYIVIDTSSWNLSSRTIYSIDGLDCLYWEDLNATPSGPKIFEEGDELPAGYIKISWDFTDKFNDIFDEDVTFWVVGDGDPENNLYIEIEVWDYGEKVRFTINQEEFHIDIPGETVISIPIPYTITQIEANNGYDYYDSIGNALMWEVVTEEEFIYDQAYQDGYSDGYFLGYKHARESYGYYDSRTDEWLTVSEYINRYGTDKPGQSDFYKNFDKYFIPAMIIVFGGAIVLTILKVFKGRE